MRWPARFVGDFSNDSFRAALLRRTLALFGLALVAVTWRLWTAQQVFPQVPFFRWLDGAPTWCQWVATAAMIGGLAGALVAPRGGRWAPVALVTFAGGMSALVLVDQERLQPWAYQFALASLVLAVAEPRAALDLLRLLVIGFYFHSALSKLDYSFLHTLGQQFLEALAGTFGASIDGWNESLRLGAAAVFPGGELLIALGLCFVRTRLSALAAAVFLHVMLLVILGPWGLQHKSGVLVWNLYFIVQDLLLFSNFAAQPSSNPAGGAWCFLKTAAPWPVRAVVLASVLLPFLAPTTWFDLWPSWGLYAACAERVQLLVHRRELEHLPKELRSLTEASADADDPWLTVRLDRWSLEALGAPIYPQSRYQLGVAEAVIARYGVMNRARVIRIGLAGRFTGKREHTLFARMPEIASAGADYFFNTRARQKQFATQPEAPSDSAMVSME